MQAMPIVDVTFKARRWVATSVIVSLLLHVVIVALLPVEAMRSIEQFGEQVTKVFRLMKIERLTKTELEDRATSEAVTVAPEEVEAESRDLLWLPSMADAFDQAIAESPEPAMPDGTETLDDVFAQSNLPLLAATADSGTADAIAGKLRGTDYAAPDAEPFDPPARRTVNRAKAPAAPVAPETVADPAMHPGVPEPPPYDPAAMPLLPGVAIGPGPAAPPPLPPLPEPDLPEPALAPPEPNFDLPAVVAPEPRIAPPDPDLPGTEPGVQIGQTPQAEEIDLAVQFETYQEPGRPDRFFRLSIGPAEGTRLNRVPQDHLFACDVSLSMSLGEIAETRAAIGRIVRDLPPEDRFNLVVFSEQVTWMYDGFRAGSPEQAQAAMDFLGRRHEQFRTDICLAVRDIAGRIRETHRPIALYLVSDGSSTKGIRNARRIVTEVTSGIGANVSVFTFNAGEEGNEYLLQLLSHMNRGEAVNTREIGGSGARFVDLVNRYRAPLLTGVRAAYGNLRVEDVYPASIPNLYEGRPIVLYGRCEASGNAAVRIVGDSQDDRKTFFANFEIDPKLQGRRDVAQGWARGRINYLVQRMAREDSRPEWLAEIRDLGRRYQVNTPFD